MTTLAKFDFKQGLIEKVPSMLKKVSGTMVIVYAFVLVSLRTCVAIQRK